MSTDNNKYFVSVSEIFSEKRQYRTPFKVDFCAWCPKTELIVVASKKGDIVLKRKCWKKCWRFDPLTISHEDAPRTVECIAWNEIGNIITVGMSDGNLIHIHADFGTILWKKSLSYPDETPVSLTKVYWGQLSRSTGIDEPGSLKQTFGDKLDNYPWLAGLSEVEKIFRSSMIGRQLFVSRDDLKISVLAAGIMTISIIDLNIIFSSLELTPCIIYDMYCNPRNFQLLVALSTHGPKPITAKNNEAIKPEKGSGEKMLHTHIASFEFANFEFLAKTCNLNSILARYLNMYNRWLHCVKDLDKIMKDWQTHYQIFSNRLLSPAKNFNIGTCLISFCLYGYGGPLGENYNEKQIQPSIGNLFDFFYSQYDQMLTCLSGEFTIAVRTCSFYMEEMSIILSYCQNSITDKSEMVKKFVERIVNHSEKIKEASLALQKSANITVQNYISNAKDLLQFIKWLTVIPVTERLASSKRKQLMPQLARMNLSEVLNFLIDVFLDDKLLAEKVSQNSFGIDEILQEEERLEAQGKYPKQYKPLTEEEKAELAKPRLPQPPEKKKKYGDNTTPTRHGKANKCRRAENPAANAWKDRLDYLSGMWMDSDVISSDILEKLGLNSNKNKDLLSVKKQLDQIRKLILEMDIIFGSVWSCNESKWMCDIISGEPNHRGFAGFSMKKFSSSETDKIILDMFMKRDGTELEKLIISAHNGNNLMYKIMSFETSHLTQLHFDLKENDHFTQVNCNNSPPLENTKFLGNLSSINSVYLENNGFLYIIATFKLDADSLPVRRLLRWHPGKPQISMHDLAFRVDQLETIYLKPESRDFGSFFSDESTRVTLFSLTF